MRGCVLRQDLQYMDENVDCFLAEEKANPFLVLLSAKIFGALRGASDPMQHTECCRRRRGNSIVFL